MTIQIEKRRRSLRRGGGARYPRGRADTGGEPLTKEVSSATRNRQRGNALVEFSLSFLLFFSLMVGMFEFPWLLFIKATLNHAVREGTRAAISGVPGTGFAADFDGYIKTVIKRHTFGFLSDAEIDDHVQIDYFDPEGNCGQPLCPATDAAAGNVVQVSILCYEVLPLTGLAFSNPIILNVASTDRLEPFPGGPPPRGTPAQATACGGP